MSKEVGISVEQARRNCEAKKIQDDRRVESEEVEDAEKEKATGSTLLW